jgi:formylglycine-generating enzyme required for sulfatase activity
MKTCKNFHCFLVLGLLLAARPVYSQTTALGVQLFAGVSITGTNAGLYAVQATSNLADPNSWACVGLVQLPATNLLWTDTTKSAATGQRFYRTVQTSTNLVYILPGTFTMGSPTNEALRGTDEVQHVVTISKGFYMGKFLVTQSEYLAVVGSNPSRFASPRYPDDFQRPVDTIGWNNATNYCALRTTQEQAAGMIPTNWVYRLPTESEWEYACRAGTVTAFYLGSSLRSQQANFAGTNEYDSVVGNINNPSGYLAGITTEGGSYAPNGWGLYDMAGNLHEWCQDWYGPYPSGSVLNPQGAVTGTLKVHRGGDFNQGGVSCRSSVRATGIPSGFAGAYYGIRVVLAPNP